MLCQAEPVSSQLSGHLLPSQILFISIQKKNLLRSSHCSGRQLAFGSVFTQQNTDQKCQIRLVLSVFFLPSFSCPLSPFFSPAYRVSHLQLGSFGNLPVPSPPPRFNFNQHSCSAQLWIQILAPCALAWTTQGWVIALRMLFCFQFSSSENSQFWPNPWDREVGWSLAVPSVVWGPAASASHGSSLGMQDLSPDSTPAQTESAYLHCNKIPKVVLSVH